MLHDRIDKQLEVGIGIIEAEIDALCQKQAANGLDRQDTDKLTEYLKVLVVIRKDWRLAEKEVKIDNTKIENLDEAIAQEIKELQSKGLL
jgi:hypothetical protein